MNKLAEDTRPWWTSPSLPRLPRVPGSCPTPPSSAPYRRGLHRLHVCTFPGPTKGLTTSGPLSPTIKCLVGALHLGRSVLPCFSCLATWSRHTSPSHLELWSTPSGPSVPFPDRSSPFGVSVPGQESTQAQSCASPNVPRVPLVT